MTDNEVLMALKVLEKLLILRKIEDKQLNVWVKLSTTDTYRTFCKQALVDLGSSTSCISWKFVKENLINTCQLLFLITCYNTNGSTNRDRSITEIIEMNMTISDYQELIQLLVTNLGNHDLFLGYDWLQKHNPTINWKDSSINLQNCQQWYRKIYITREPEEKIEKEIEEDAIEDREKVLFINLEEAWRREELNIRSTKMKEKEKDIPKEYENFNNWAFNKAVFKKLLD